MSIMPAMNASEPPPEPGPNESAIVRRWLWRQGKTMFLFGLAMLLGAGLAQQAYFRQHDNTAFGSDAEMRSCRETLRQTAVRLAAIQREMEQHATVLIEPNQGQEIIMGALGLLLGVPTGAIDIAKGLAPPQPRWILKGKQKPMSNVPGASFSWVNLETRQTEGPFKPEAPQ